MAQQTEHNNEKPVFRILQIDGGGLRGCMTAKILEKMESEIRELKGCSSIKIADMFDLIIGTSAGGMLALGLGRLGWNANQLTEANEEIQKVFPNGSKMKATFKNPIGMIKGTGVLDNDDFERSLKKVIDGNANAKNVNCTKMFNENNNANGYTNCCVIATRIDGPYTVPYVFRSYHTNAKNDEDDADYKTFEAKYNNGAFKKKWDYQGCTDVNVWEAARATSAAPFYFSALALNKKGIFIDGGIVSNTALGIACVEASKIAENNYGWNKNEYSMQIVSIGTGFRSFADYDVRKEAFLNHANTQFDPRKYLFDVGFGAKEIIGLIQEESKHFGDNKDGRSDLIRFQPFVQNKHFDKNVIERYADGWSGFFKSFIPFIKEKGNNYKSDNDETPEELMDMANKALLSGWEECVNEFIASDDFKRRLKSVLNDYKWIDQLTTIY